MSEPVKSRVDDLPAVYREGNNVITDAYALGLAEGRRMGYDEEARDHHKWLLSHDEQMAAVAAEARREALLDAADDWDTRVRAQRGRGWRGMSGLEIVEWRDADDLLAKVASVLGELYEPAGVLMFWSARIKYLDDKRPCDLWRDRDLKALDALWRRLEGLADGAFA